ncbi:glycoside hydrolase family 9 protein [Actinokineospora sp. PR83]|uniref:glycoside hydrolase family 9 protein n=1 Tax=Actinokineospora sp. PR83 TaxID=2884908 RepID=UPI001F35C331|nr:glycoside hydrolase family 9 protein [Actinokineospora sp. PR83]MCG8919160.1 glycoside hydrolase family 9 protein [Actinokineospora sp. PR83]
MSRLVLCLAATLLAACAAACGSPAPSPTGFVRVDQVGYRTDEAKLAFLMGSAGDASFQVVDESGRTVLNGVAGPSTGSWNTGFPEVRALDFSAVRTPGSYRVLATGAEPSPVFPVGSGAELFGPQVAANVHFFQAQRDGADVIPSIVDRKPAHLNDAAATVYEVPRYDETGSELLDDRLTPVGGPVDVSGGWFDAGDFLKFTHTTAYSTALLLLAQRDTPAGGPELAAEARHGLAWLDKVWDDSTGTLHAQVGIGAGNEGVRTDHDVWRLPEADEAPGADPALARRPVFRAADPGQPISPNLAGKVAAAFALAAQTTTGDAALRALDKAAKAYDLADREPDALVTAYPHAFYPEASWQDDLEFAAAELARAGRALGDPRTGGWTRDAGHWAADYLASDALGTLGVGDVSALAHADLVELLDTGAAADEVTRDRLTGDLARQLDDGSARAAGDPFRAGADYLEFDAVPHAFGLAATALLHRLTTGEDTYAAFGTQQRNWALGANPWGSSFVIGAGSAYPRCPEHQIANLTGRELTGAAVNGPNRADRFTELNRFPTMRPCASEDSTRFDGHGARFVDDVGAWQSVEPADDFTATALLAFALTSR